MIIRRGPTRAPAPALAPALALVVIIGAGLSWAVLPSAAHAADGLSLSLDGEQWASTVDTPLWDPRVRWVPGDSRSVSLWVRNDTGTPSTLRVEVVTAGRDATAAELADRLTATARVDGTTTRVDDDLVPVPAPRPHQEQRVELTMTFPAGAGNRTQTDVSATRVRITLTERRDRRGTLPGTGGPPGAVVVAGGAVVAAGALLVRARRRTAGGAS